MSKEFVWTDEMVKEFVRWCFNREPHNYLPMYIEEFKKEKLRTPLFTTEDGVAMYPGDTCYEVDKDLKKTTVSTWINIPDTLSYLTWRFDDFIYFSTIKNAQEYILLNRPLLSVNDVCNWYFKENRNLNSEWDFKNRLQAIAKSKL